MISNENIKLQISVAILVAIISVCFAWGPRTHIEISQVAFDYLDDDLFDDLPTFLDTYRGAIFAGSIFPDWAFVVIDDNLSRHAHQVSFEELYWEILLEKFPDMSTTVAQRELAFYMGLLSHIYADRILHGYHDPPGMNSFLVTGMATDGVTEEIIEGSLDIVIGYESSVSSFTWFWPYGTLRDVYHAYGDTGVTESQLITGTTGLETTVAAVEATGYFSYLAAKAAIPWCYDNYEDYHPGGLLNSSSLVALKFRKAWAYAINKIQIFQKSQYDCGYQNCFDNHLLADVYTNNAGGEDGLLGTIDASSNYAAILIKWILEDLDTTLGLDSAKACMYYQSRLGSWTGDESIAAYRINRNWGEGDKHDGSESNYNGAPMSSSDEFSCWTHAFYNSTPWNSPGLSSTPGDRQSVADDNLLFTSSSAYPAWHNWDITSTTLHWIENPSENYGVLLKEDTNDHNGRVIFTSSENWDVHCRPMLMLYLSDRPLAVDQHNSQRIPSEKSIRMYPNPFNSEIRIDLNFKPNSLKIYDINGNLIHDVMIENSAKSYIWQPYSRLESGIYFIHILNNSLTYTKKIVYLK